MVRFLSSTRTRASLLAFIAALLLPALLPASPEEMAKQVTIYRDEFGVPHVDGPTDASVIFGYAYAQAEDYFWQIEDTYLQCLGRYSETVGEAGLDWDLLNHLFEIPSRSKADYEKLEPELRMVCEAYTDGLNFFLAKNPSVKPRVLTHFEPWFVIAYERHMMFLRLYPKANAPSNKLKEIALAETEPDTTGSNGWAIGPSKTRTGNAMLFVNPHQPWFGYGQWYEGHLRSAEGWNFSGASFFGGPFPSIGHNESLGWTHTVNAVDTSDSYRLTFDDPQHPLNYRYDNGYKTAEEWKDTIKVKTDKGLEERPFTFRKTHHGPIVSKEDATHFIAVKIAKLFEGSRLRQSRLMTKSKTFAEWQSAMAMLNLQMFNTVYADNKGNIYYVYNGAVPRRDPSFDWTKPVDGADPRTEWKGLHPLAELPQLFNPATGYVQNCNSSPYTTTDDGNPFPLDFPAYLGEEANFDNRRARMSRHLLRQAKNVTFDQWQKLAFDTTLYWPMSEMPKFAIAFDDLKKRNPDLAGKAEPYLKHLLNWDFKNRIDSTQTLLCTQWYEELYGSGYPKETLKQEFIDNPDARFQALVTAAGKLVALHGDWKVKWGDVKRMQRIANVADGSKAPFDDTQPSIPVPGVNGPLGVAFNTYYTAMTPERKKAYGTTGASFAAVYEFGKTVKAMSILQFGESSDPKSPHFFDQAQLYSRQRFKPAWFEWKDVLAHTERKYHPGEQTGS